MKHKVKSSLPLLPFSEIWQITIYHIQDIQLFYTSLKKVYFQGVLSVVHHNITSLFKFAVVSLKEICVKNMNAISKSWLTISIVPIIIACFSVLFAVVFLLSKWKVKTNFVGWKSRILAGTLLLVMYANQKITSTLFSLSYCIPLGEKKHLLLYGETECWQIWQIIILVYIILVIFPQCLVFLFGPGLLNSKYISTQHFLLAIFCPCPFLLHWITILMKNRTSKIKDHCKSAKANHTQPPFAERVLEEIYTSFDSEKFPYFICWGGFIEIRRLGLLICSIFVSNHIAKLFIMTVTCLMAAIGIAFFKPYAVPFINHIALTSVTCQVLVGIINLMFTIYDNLQNDVLRHMMPTVYAFLYMQDFLSAWVPFCTLALSAFYNSYQKMSGKLLAKPIRVKWRKNIKTFAE